MDEKRRESSVGPHLWQLNAARDALFLLGVFVALAVAYRFKVIFTPVLLAFLAAYLAQPIIAFAERRLRLSPQVCAAAFIVALLAILLALGCWLGPLIGRQFARLVYELPAYAGAVSGRVSRLLNMIGMAIPAADLVRAAAVGAGRLLGMLSQLASSLVEMTFGLLIGVVCFYTFVTRKWCTFALGDKRLDPRVSASLITCLHVLGQSFSSFFRGRFLIALINAPLFSISWKLAGVPYWLILGIMAAVLNIVPYVSVIAWAAALALTYADVVTRSQEPGLFHVVLLPTLTFAAVHFIEGWFLTPLIQSREVDLSAAAILVAVALGGAALGFIGLLLAVPIAASLKILLFLPGGPSPPNGTKTHPY